MNVKLIRKDGSTEIMTDSELAALAPSLNYLSHNGDDQDGIQPVKREATDAQQADADARAAAEAAEQAIRDAVTPIYADYTYPPTGDVFAVNESFIGKCDALMNKRGRGKVNKTPLQKKDGGFANFRTPADLDAFLAAFDDEMQTRQETASDALAALQP